MTAHVAQGRARTRDLYLELGGTMSARTSAEMVVLGVIRCDLTVSICWARLPVLERGPAASREFQSVIWPFGGTLVAARWLRIG